MGTTGLVGVMVLVSLVGTGEPAKPTVDFRLQDHRGAWHTLDEARDRKVVVLAFLGTECPLAEAYAPRLAELARDFGKRGVAFFGVDANQQDGPVAIGRFAEKHGLPFVILKDVGNDFADRLGAERTPEVFVLDASRAIVYRGRIDDQYAIGIHRPSSNRHDLLDALDAVLDGRPVATPRTDAVGCKIGRVAKSAPGRRRDVRERGRSHPPVACVTCHRPGEIAPFSLTDYRQAAGWSSMIAEVVDEGRMPPWHASPEHGKFANDARLSAVEKKAIRDWVAAGSPEGDPADLPPPPRFVEGWQIPRPDVVLEMPREIEIPAEGSMPYELVKIDPKITHDVWVRASQVRPGNPAVVHHAVVYVLPPGVEKIDEAGGDFLAAYAPGLPPRVLADGVAKRIPAGSKIVLQLHYTPRGNEAGRPESDRPPLRRPGESPQRTDVGHGAQFSLPDPARDARLRLAGRFPVLAALVAPLADAAHAPEGQVDEVRRRIPRRPSRGHPRRTPIRVRLAEPLRPRPAQADARRDDHPHRSPLRQLGRESEQPGSQAGHHLRRADVGRDARRIPQLRPRRPGPHPRQAHREATGEWPVRGHLPSPPRGAGEVGRPRRHVHRLEGTACSP